jgi:hypothetical protein
VRRGLETEGEERAADRQHDEEPGARERTGRDRRHAGDAHQDPKRGRSHAGVHQADQMGAGRRDPVGESDVECEAQVSRHALAQLLLRDEEPGSDSARITKPKTA